MKFHGTQKELTDKLVSLIGGWYIDAPNGKIEFRSEDGRSIMIWYPTTGTLQFQGKVSSVGLLQKQVELLLFPKPEIIHTHTDCRTESGITVGLIDSLISISRVLKDRIDMSDESIHNAISDLRNDQDVKIIMGIGQDDNLPF